MQKMIHSHVLEDRMLPRCGEYVLDLTILAITLGQDDDVRVDFKVTASHSSDPGKDKVDTIVRPYIDYKDDVMKDAIIHTLWYRVTQAIYDEYMEIPMEELY
jgi:hypothetical protein